MNELKEKLAELCHKKQREWVEWAWNTTPYDLERSRVDASLPDPGFELVAHTWANEVLALMRGTPEDTSWRAAAILLREAIKEHRSKVLAGSITTVLRDVLDTTRWMEGRESGASAQEWISVEDRLPKMYELVWAIRYGDYALVRRNKSGWAGPEGSIEEGVTHWLPLGLPEVPK